MEPVAGPLRLRRWPHADGWTTVAQLSDLDGPTEAFVDGHPVVLVRLGEEVFAVDGRCPHRGGPLAQAVLEGCALRCPWHGFKYDVRTGRPAWPEGWDPVPTYATRITDGWVEVLVERMEES
ncbi:MAG TPA: Rieske 2Fe-2S domain-containing protein [Chloroflexota bacterium]